MRSEIHQLREMLRAVGQQPQRADVIPSGTSLDWLLPERGFSRGTLVEWLESRPGSGAGILALTAARVVCRAGGLLVVLDHEHSFYPPAVASQIALQDTIFLQPANDKDESWALDQALRCSAVAAVLAWPKRLDSYTFRRLQLAAEQGGGVGLLIRPAAARQEPSWANVRLLVRAIPRNDSAVPSASASSWRLSVELLHCRGRFDKHAVEFEIDQQTGEIRDAHPRPLAAQLAHPAPAPYQARA